MALKRGQLAAKLAEAKREGWDDWIRGPADEAALLDGCYFDVAAAERPRRFFSSFLKHSKGARFAGRPFELLDWQYRDVIGPVFGWRRADGSRRYRRAYVEIPKKNGKSTLAAGVSLYLTLGDGEPGAHVYSAATDRDQASIVYDEAANMVDASPALSRVLRVRRSTKLVLHPSSKSRYEAISSDADSSEGKDAHGLILDELHAWRERAFFESLMYAGRARAQPLLFIITTAGDDVASVCYEEHERAARVLAGDELAPSYFAYIRAAEPTDDWKAPDTWAKANPSFGVTVNADSFAEDCKEAQETPRKEAAFKRYSLNLWVGHSAQWLASDVWARCREAFEERDLYGLDAWAGIDLSRVRDLSAVVWIVPRAGRYYLVPRVYMPRELLDRKEKEDKAPYRAWAAAGLIRLTDGDVVDYSVIRADVVEDSTRWQLVEAGYDPYNAEHLCNQQLRIEDGLETVAVTQSMAHMGPATAQFEALAKQGRLVHDGNELLAWAIGGAAVYEDTNGNIRPIKRRSKARIDPIVAAIMGLGRALAGGEAAGNFYDDHDVEVL